ALIGKASVVRRKPGDRGIRGTPHAPGKIVETGHGDEGHQRDQNNGESAKRAFTHGNSRSSGGFEDGNVLRIHATGDPDVKRFALPLLDAQKAVPAGFAEYPAVQALPLADLVLEVAEFTAGLILPAFAFEGQERIWILASIEFTHLFFGHAQV